MLKNKTLIALTMVFLLGLSSCISPQNPRATRSTSSTGEAKDGDKTSPGNGSTPDTGDDIGDSVTEAVSIVELTQIVDPNTGTFRKKVSIPKDFEGYMYLSGLNIASLNKDDKIISVKFSFGREKNEIIVPAVIGRVPGGLQNGTNIDVIILDMDSKPFKNLRLLYDLFDYNDYGEEDPLTATDPTQDATNPGLYCRGLNIEDDPTFEWSQANSTCDSAGETCLYAYAKIADTTLGQSVLQDGTPVLVQNIPTYELYDVLGAGYTGDTNEYTLKKCLPDSGLESDTEATLGRQVLPWGISGLADFDGTNYLYMGPYQTFGTERTWEISSDAIFSPIALADDTPKGIFQYSFTGGATTGYKSFLFPRAGKINYSQSGVQYFGASYAFNSKALLTLPTAGDTKWMDGCNIRAKNMDSYSKETISSCNVSATIEIIAYNDGVEEVLATSKDVKIQLLKAGLGVTQGKEFSAMKTCTDNRSCGTGECCFNSRCFSKDIVAQCKDDSAGTGNLGTGLTCQSDFECSSLCCRSGVCADHFPDDLNAVLCSKVPSQTCVSKEFCRVENVRECYIIKTKDSNGNDSCEKRCYSVPKNGDCVNGACQAPTSSSDPTFDLTDPNRCDDAYDSPPVTL